jgi:hypothetical membrane protein
MAASGTASGSSRLGIPTNEVIEARRPRLLFALAVAGIVLYIALDAIAQSLPPHYSPLSQAESDLAVGPYGYLMTLNFINRGGLSLCFLFALLLAANSSDIMSPRLRRGAYLFAIWSVGALLLAVFPTDVPATPVSWHGAIHLLVAAVAFLGGAFGALYISLGMAGNKSIAAARGVALPLAYVTVVLCLAEIFGGFAAHGFYANYGGLVERIFLASVLLWIGTVSGILLARPGLQGPASPEKLESDNP